PHPNTHIYTLSLHEPLPISRTYQLSSKTNATNKLDKINYAHSYVRPMMAEVIVDVINSALGVEEMWGPNGKSDVKPGSKAVEVGDRKSTRLNSSHLVISYAV